MAFTPVGLCAGSSLETRKVGSHGNQEIPGSSLRTVTSSVGVCFLTNNKKTMRSGLQSKPADLAIVTSARYTRHNSIHILFTYCSHFFVFSPSTAGA